MSSIATSFSRSRLSRKIGKKRGDVSTREGQRAADQQQFSNKRSGVTVVILLVSGKNLKREKHVGDPERRSELGIG